VCDNCARAIDAKRRARRNVLIAFGLIIVAGMVIKAIKSRRTHSQLPKGAPPARKSPSGRVENRNAPVKRKTGGARYFPTAI
jgi:hypothetical protein